MQFKRLLTVFVVAAAFLAVLPLTVLAASGQVDTTPQPAAAETLGPNLLTNGGVDGKYVKQCSLRNSGQPWVQVPCPADYNSEVSTVEQWETTQVPYGWSAWWQPPNNNLNDPNYFNSYPNFCPDWGRTPSDCRAWHNPEYRDTLGGPQETGPERKLAGDNSQKYFTFYSVHEAGIYQVVSGVKPGDHLRFSAFQEGWSTGTNDPFHSDLGQRMNLQVGIDPTGGNNPWSPNIVWSAPAESFDKFTQFTIDAVAKNNIVSVWTKSKPNMALEHVDVYVDEASLNVVQAAKVAKAAPSKTTKVTKIITSTKVITSASGITSTVIVTRSIVVTIPLTGTTRPTTSTVPTKPVSGTVSSKPVSGTVGTKAPTAPVTGTLPIPASGTYTVVKGDSLSKIARRFGISLATLIALNDIKDPDRIDAGTVLRLK